MKSAVVTAGVKDMATINEHNIAGLSGNNGDRKRFRFRASESFAEHFSGAADRKQASVSVVIHLQNLGGTGKHNPDILGRFAFRQDGVLLIKLYYFRPQAPQHTQQVILPDLGE